jgi:hypothetical protein
MAFDFKKLNPMALKDFDWKQFFIEKGERVGLGVTGTLMVVITIVSLFLPEHGFLVPTPLANAKELSDSADRVSSKQSSARPTDADKPPAVGAVPVSFDSEKIDDASAYQFTKLFLAPPAGSTRRRMPELFQPDEATATVALSQIRSFVFNRNGDDEYGYIATLEASGNGATQLGSGQPGGAGAPPPGFTQNLAGGGGGMSRGIGGGGVAVAQNSGPGGRSGAPNLLRPGQSANPTKSATNVRFVEVSKLSEGSLPRFEEQALPLRQAIICASFPYRKQVEEFQRKLHLPSLGAVLGEASEEQDGGGLLPAFRFLGVDVERREISLEGKPIDNKWKKLDLTAELKPYIIANGTRFEDDPQTPPELASLIIDGLWMPLLKQFDENKSNKYPRVEMELKNIQKTLADLKGKPADTITVGTNPITSRGDSFDPFATRQKRVAQAVVNRPSAGGPAAMTPQPGGRPGGGMSRGLGGRGTDGRLAPRMGPGGGQAAYAPGGNLPELEGVVPEYALVRVVDVTIEPGKIYEYRLHVRMANPNYKRNAEVLSPSYAVEKELNTEKDRTDSDWFVVPKKVKVPPEFYYYAVDMKELEGRSYNGIHGRETPARDQQTAFQIQRWLVNASTNDNPEWVGEWAVAERVLVYRGEYIGRTERVNVPYWHGPSEKFILLQPQQEATRQKVPGVPVDFSLPDDDAILVDFDGGLQHYERKARREDKGETVKTDDRISTETLIVASDGHLTARDSTLDALNKLRNERLSIWRNRILDVIMANVQISQGAGAQNPFAPGGAGGVGRPKMGGR